MIWFRVTNNEQGAQLILDETAELYDFNISWNSMNADESKVIEKLDTVGKLMATYDRQWNQVDSTSIFARYWRQSIQTSHLN